MTSRMGLCCCSRAVEQLLQCLLTGSRHCCSHLQQLLQLLLHMKAKDIVKRTGRTWKRLWGGDPDPQHHIRVLLVGKRFTGKTALVYRLKLGAFIPTIPSIGSNTELFMLHLRSGVAAPSLPSEQQDTQGEDRSGDSSDIERGPAAASGTPVRVVFCDVAGGDGESLEWHGLQRGCDCVCFAVDSTASPTSIEDARRELLELFYDEHFVLRRGTPFLVLATKQDLRNARSAAELESLLELPDEVKKTCKVLGCSAISGAGILQVQQWLGAAATAASKSSSYWQRSSCGSFHRGSSISLSACDSTSFHGMRQEMLGAFAPESVASSQASPDPLAKAGTDEESSRQSLQSSVLLEQRVSSYPHLLDCT